MRSGACKTSIEGLPLAAATPPGWAEVATSDVDALLVDHAHCELKAASTALAIVGRFAERTELVRSMTALAHEEMRHFARVHRLVCRRGGALRRVKGDRYASALRKRVQRGFDGVPTLLDQLILCMFIEARSCERFRLLASAEFPPAPADFYAELADAEARHHELFLGHAVDAAGEEAAKKRVREVAEIEGKLILELPPAPRIH